MSNKKKDVTPRLNPKSIEYWEQQKQLNKIEEWVSNGIPMKDVAKNMGIGRTTLYEWLDKSTHITDALHAGRKVKLEKVEHAMFMRAIGYDKEEVHYKFDEEGNKFPMKSRVVHYPGEPSLIKYYANNTDPSKWKDRVDVTDEKSLEKLDTVMEMLDNALKEDKK